MTRINSGIQPRRLTRAHLLAEHREMKRIPNMVANGRANMANIPQTFRLGAGHCSFFYNKLGYLLRRYRAVHAEALRRGYSVTDFSSAWDNVPSDCMGDWMPTPEARLLIEQRIRARGVHMEPQTGETTI